MAEDLWRLTTNFGIQNIICAQNRVFDSNQNNEYEIGRDGNNESSADGKKETVN